MKTSRPLLCLILLVLLGSPALGQLSSKEAERLAQTLSGQNDLPVNVRLRFALMGDMLGGLLGKGDSSNTLSFFSTTRIMTWNQPLSAQTAQAMRDLEAQMVTLARAKGFNLDLPPVGYSTVGASTAAPPPDTVPGAPLWARRSDREELFLLVLRAEEMGTAGLANAPSPELQGLRDSLTVLRQDLMDTQVATDAVRNVLLARAVYLSSAVAGADQALLQKLDLAAEALRANFPPETLRQARGQLLTI